VSDLTLFILRLVFLAVLWVFVFIVVFALRSDLFGQRVRRLPATASAPFDAGQTQPAPAAAPRDSAIASRLVITGGAKEGLQIDLPDEILSIGRSSDSGLVVRDDYTSTNHARLLRTERGWVLEDLDSTNGTLLDGSKVSSPTQVPLNTPITIGTTTFELRR
jgi:pSer/pThr/pTyr-binding forkhead associated (FHA) protein